MHVPFGNIQALTIVLLLPPAVWYELQAELEMTNFKCPSLGVI